MKTVLLRGPLITASGYGQHARMFARWLLQKEEQGLIKLRTQLLPWGSTPWMLHPDFCDGMVGKLLERNVPDPTKEKFDVSFQVQLPNEFDSSLAAFNVGVTAAVETDRCHPSWVDACNKVDAVVFPSNHSKLSVVNTGAVTKPVHVIPESFTDACKLPADKLPTLPRFSTDFNFLVVGQITGNNVYNDRKNVFFTLKWLFEEFRGDRDVGIVLKTNAGRNNHIDRDAVVGLVNSVVQEARKDSDHPRVHLLHGDMSDEEVAALYKHPQVKALVTLTRGEGFGLPILEAAASGLPVIATGWSGHLDFMKLGKFISVFYQLDEVHPTRIDGNIFVKGARWANPDEKDFKARARKFKNSPTIPREWAKDLQEKLLERYSFEAVAAKFDEAFAHVLTP